jgi:hypothetical protein
LQDGLRGGHRFRLCRRKNVLANPQVGWVEANRLLNSAADKKLNSPNRRGPVCTVVYREASDGLPMSILSFDYRGGIGGAFLFEKLLTGGIRLVPKSLLQISITR